MRALLKIPSTKFYHRTYIRIPFAKLVYLITKNHLNPSHVVYNTLAISHNQNLAYFLGDGSTCIHHPNLNYCNFITKYPSSELFYTAFTVSLLYRSHISHYKCFSHHYSRILQHPHKKHLRNLRI